MLESQHLLIPMLEASAKTGNKPGVTKGKQWIKLNKNVELLDTPGILWPKFDNQEVGKRLAMIGSMNDEILNVEELAIDTIKYIYSGRSRTSPTSTRRSSQRPSRTVPSYSTCSARTCPGPSSS